MTNVFWYEYALHERTKTNKQLLWKHGSQATITCINGLYMDGTPVFLTRVELPPCTPVKSVSLKEVVRAPVGSVCWVEHGQEERNKKHLLISSYATHAGAKVASRGIQGFDPNDNPYYVIRVEVLKQGWPIKKPTGRPKGSKNKRR